MQHYHHHQKPVDEEFLKAGKHEGLEIWRIDHFKLTPISQKCYGQFHSGDSYLILHVIREF